MEAPISRLIHSGNRQVSERRAESLAGTGERRGHRKTNTASLLPCSFPSSNRSLPPLPLLPPASYNNNDDDGARREEGEKVGGAVAALAGCCRDALRDTISASALDARLSGAAAAVLLGLWKVDLFSRKNRTSLLSTGGNNNISMFYNAHPHNIILTISLTNLCLIERFYLAKKELQIFDMVGATFELNRSQSYRLDIYQRMNLLDGAH